VSGHTSAPAGHNKGNQIGSVGRDGCGADGRGGAELAGERRRTPGRHCTLKRARRLVGGADGSLLVDEPEHRDENEHDSGGHKEQDGHAAEHVAGVVDVDGGAEEAREPDVTGTAAAHAGADEEEETLGEAFTMGAVNAGSPTVGADAAAVFGWGRGRLCHCLAAVRDVRSSA